MASYDFFNDMSHIQADLFFFLIGIFVCFFETGSPCIALAVLELAL